MVNLYKQINRIIRKFQNTASPYQYPLFRLYTNRQEYSDKAVGYFTEISDTIYYLCTLQIL